MNFMASGRKTIRLLFVRTLKVVEESQRNIFDISWLYSFYVCILHISCILHLFVPNINFHIVSMCTNFYFIFFQLTYDLKHFQATKKNEIERSEHTPVVAKTKALKTCRDVTIIHFTFSLRSFSWSDKWKTYSALPLNLSLCVCVSLPLRCFVHFKIFGFDCSHEWQILKNYACFPYNSHTWMIGACKWNHTFCLACKISFWRKMKKNSDCSHNLYHTTIRVI